ncbi:hypothetical protein H5410_001821 [Solanum commersonii]|uniref:Uncharacterized protein n=1 Tax=Solanum commersonii TaxID=4109 RepID=A0A9J6B049_SOLCO|nr:hypothetical protein H5410_001821 [Solanum commersonii]
MWNKYCRKHIPILVQWKGASQVWNLMLENREVQDQNIWWERKGGSSNRHGRHSDIGMIIPMIKKIWVEGLPFEISLFSLEGSEA